MWHPSDVPALLELALLRDTFLQGKSSLAREVAIRSGDFGLTPAGRQQRRWIMVEGLEPAPDELAEQRRKAERRKELSKKLN